MASLEGIAYRYGSQQVRLNYLRGWMAQHVEPHLRDCIRYEGFWATRRPQWSRSRTPSDGYLQVGGLCGFPVVIDDREAVLTTCVNGRGITWDIALERGYTRIPKPFTEPLSTLQGRPSSITLASRAWRSRRSYPGLVAAFQAERAAALDAIQRENDRRIARAQAAASEWRSQRDAAIRAFRERHS